MANLLFKKKIVIFLTSGIGNSFHQLGIVLKLKESFSGEVHYSNILSSKNIVTFILNKILLRPWTIHQNNIFERNEIPKNKDNLFSYIALIILFFKTKSLRKENNTFLGYCSVKFFNTTYIFGYFQDKLLLNWDESRKIIRKSIKKLNSKKLNNILTIHIREGDPEAAKGGISFENYSLDDNYYEKSIKEIFRYFSSDIKKINITGVLNESRFRDIKKLIKRFSDIKVIRVRGNYQEDFGLIWHSKYIIASNSTFSFWSGYYGESEVIYLPKLFKSYNLESFRKKITFL